MSASEGTRSAARADVSVDRLCGRLFGSGHVSDMESAMLNQPSLVEHCGAITGSSAPKFSLPVLSCAWPREGYAVPQQQRLGGDLVPANAAPVGSTQNVKR